MVGPVKAPSASEPWPPASSLTATGSESPPAPTWASRPPWSRWASWRAGRCSQSPKCEPPAGPSQPRLRLKINAVRTRVCEHPSLPPCSSPGSRSPGLGDPDTACWEGARNGAGDKASGFVPAGPRRQPGLSKGQGVEDGSPRWPASSWELGPWPTAPLQVAAIPSRASPQSRQHVENTLRAHARPGSKFLGVGAGSPSRPGPGASSPSHRWVTGHWAPAGRGQARQGTLAVTSRESRCLTLRRLSGPVI
nr:NADH dehydrogenase [ubiquinone] 1 alpha subcomplex subunit 11 isoform X1 [Equus caballus]